MRVFAVYLVFHCAALAQISQRPVFEAASVKPATVRGGGYASLGNVPAFKAQVSQLSYPEASLSGLISRAYNIVPLRLSAPEWMRNERYTVVAKVPRGAGKELLPVMLQNLLADRFQSTVHWDNRQESGYALTVGKGGPKLKASAPDSASASGMSGNGHLTWTSATLDDVAISLSLFMDRSVVNMTGIEDAFDLAFDAAPDSMPGFRFGQGKDSSFPTIFTALRDLGLNLEAKKVSVKYLVVDSALKVPAENE
jgi:uncharacterized protein (TIGR03435 family)